MMVKIPEGIQGVQRFYPSPRLHKQSLTRALSYDLSHDLNRHSRDKIQVANVCPFAKYECVSKANHVKALCHPKNGQDRK